ncbi:hypothetical protein FKW77_001784 [Venturia effusa]|uniref:MutL C-terminal dimerisation domain-containing protein n=1 Tax=Venturia effusa TaxID=50376 RepID=A0A517LKW0_9PEZI|nr:hypothetical protein FKW77_001784 [Venturia effusa]
MSVLPPPSRADAHQAEVGSAIVALPPDVIAQIKSSATITTLTSTILGLVRNSLDAQATSITVHVDFQRGGCIVEDDGLGISPSEFGEHGGLGKAYPRLVPAPASYRLDCRNHGTKVSVRDLFGNMPVRVKQRHLVSEDKSEQDRLWLSLTQSIVSLVIASERAAALKLHNSGTTKSLTLFAPRVRNSLELGPGLPDKLQKALSTLQQAGMISPGNMSAWIPASASSRTITIKGGICLEPAPSKSTQFLSLGTNPLPRSRHNELYDHINRLFSRSRFGIAEDEPLSEQEKSRRQRDGRYKQDGLTTKQLLAEKGVDRWPMFVLTISFKDNVLRHGHHTLDSDNKLAAVVAVLDALVNGWLVSNHFRPHKQKAIEKDSLFQVSDQSTARGLLAQDTHPTERDRALAHREQRPTLQQRLTSQARPYTGVSSMNELSRIKSANRSLLEKGRPYTPGTKRSQTAPDIVPSSKRRTPGHSTERVKPSSDKLAYVCELSRNDLQLIAAAKERPSLHANQENYEEPLEMMQDEVINWTDPITNQNHRINSRTGAIIAPRPRKDLSHSRGSCLADRENQSLYARPLRMSARAETTKNPGEEEWLGSVLKNWQNPVFRCAEQRIQQASLHVSGQEAGAVMDRRFNFTTRAEMDQAFKEVSHLNASQITKEALANAKVISQVDKKFILVTLTAGGEIKTSSQSALRTMLVVVDQHAADERVKVEQLLQELSRPPSKTGTTYKNSLGHTPGIRTWLLAKPPTFRISAKEIEHFETHATRFAEWGILYDLPQSTKEIREDKESDIIVRCLPPVIAERCRLDPKLLINLLRGELWKLVDYSSSSSSVYTIPTTSSTIVEGHGERSEHDWLMSMGSLPQGILDMVNSRACRSAIMFNDALSKSDCENLIRELAKCTFPFMCAHGRPSMVPLLDLGSVRNGDGVVLGSGKVGEKRKSGFAGAFGRWKRGQEA